MLAIVVVAMLGRTRARGRLELVSNRVDDDPKVRGVVRSSALAIRELPYIMPRERRASTRAHYLPPHNSQVVAPTDHRPRLWPGPPGRGALSSGPGARAYAVWGLMLSARADFYQQARG